MRRLAVPLVLVALTGAGCGDDAPRATATPPATEGPATTWRVEAWHDLAVDVPADWGWGSAPIDIGLGGPSLCGGPDPGSDRPYVGRPIATSDVCFAADQMGTPGAPYVWLGAAVEPGRVELGDGWVQETVTVHGTTLTVGSDDPALRRTVLKSARGVTECPGSADELAGDLPMPVEGIATVESAVLCAYAREDGTWRLTYARLLPAAEAQVLKDAIFAGQRDHAAPCAASDEAVVVTFTGTGPYGDNGLELNALVDPVCRTTTTGGATGPLPDRVLELWRETGLGSVLSALVGAMG